MQKAIPYDVKMQQAPVDPREDKGYHVSAGKTFGTI
jgi:hypothetical protein